MARVRVKICGITRPEDAAMACRLGADAIGMVFHAPARRCISLDQARHIISATAAFVTPVALFVDQAAATVVATARTLGIWHIQLNGLESPDYVAALGEFRVIKSIRVQPETFVAELARWRDAIDRLRLTNLAAIVLETGGTGLPGGSGVANDWRFIHAQQQAGAMAGLPPIIAAGGLTPETVADVVRTIHPFAVDVSSGVESGIGEKSANKMEQFIEAVRRAEM